MYELGLVVVGLIVFNHIFPMLRNLNDLFESWISVKLMRYATQIAQEQANAEQYNTPPQNTNAIGFSVEDDSYFDEN